MFRSRKSVTKEPVSSSYRSWSHMRSVRACTDVVVRQKRWALAIFHLMTGGCHYVNLLLTPFIWLLNPAHSIPQTMEMKNPSEIEVLSLVKPGNHLCQRRQNFPPFLTTTKVNQLLWPFFSPISIWRFWEMLVLAQASCWETSNQPLWPTIALNGSHKHKKWL